MRDGLTRAVKHRLSKTDLQDERLVRFCEDIVSAVAGPEPIGGIVDFYESAMLARGRRMTSREASTNMLKAVADSIVDPKTNLLKRTDMTYEEAWTIMHDAAPSHGEGE